MRGQPAASRWESAEAAADPQLAVVLIVGLWATTLSMTPAALADRCVPSSLRSRSNRREEGGDPAARRSHRREVREPPSA
jgi:hypothetical protein